MHGLSNSVTTHFALSLVKSLNVSWSINLNGLASPFSVLNYQWTESDGKKKWKMKNLLINRLGRREVAHHFLWKFTMHCPVGCATCVKNRGYQKKFISPCENNGIPLKTLQIDLPTFDHSPQTTKGWFASVRGMKRHGGKILGTSYCNLETRNYHKRDKIKNLVNQLLLYFLWKKLLYWNGR